MSDLNDFFAKKDRKKKKAAAKSALAAATQETKPEEVHVEPTPRGPVVPTPPKQPDDGWIEIEDLRGSQVNTGGRTVVEFRRDTEEKEVNGEGVTQTEKFSGWAKTNEAEAEETQDTVEKTTAPTPIAQAPISSYPSLADAAKVKHIATPYSKTGSSYSSSSSRPRFINSNTEKLRQKLAERAPK